MHSPQPQANAKALPMHINREIVLWTHGKNAPLKYNRKLCSLSSEEQKHFLLERRNGKPSSNPIVWFMSQNALQSIVHNVMKSKERVFLEAKLERFISRLLNILMPSLQICYGTFIPTEILLAHFYSSCKKSLGWCPKSFTNLVKLVATLPALWNLPIIEI